MLLPSEFFFCFFFTIKNANKQIESKTAPPNPPAKPATRLLLEPEFDVGFFAGEGVALGAEGDELTEGLVEAVGVGVTEGVRVAVGVGVRVAVGVADGLTDRVGVGEAVGVEDGVGMFTNLKFIYLTINYVTMTNYYPLSSFHIPKNCWSELPLVNPVTVGQLCIPAAEFDSMKSSE